MGSSGFEARPEVSLFAGARVRDFAAARGWYERLLGEVAFEPHATEAVWEISDERFIYIFEDAAPGGAAITVVVSDFEATLERIAGRGLEPDELETYSNGVRKATFRDPDGNEIGFGAAPQ